MLPKNVKIMSKLKFKLSKFFFHFPEKVHEYTRLYTKNSIHDNSLSTVHTRIQIHKAPMQFHAWKHMIRMIPYNSMHGTMTSDLPCNSTHGII